MNIAFDAAAILGLGSKNRGIGNYALGQFSTMIDNDQDNKYFFFNVFEEFSLSDYVIHKERLVECYYYMGKSNCLRTNTEYKRLFEDLVKKFLKEKEIDVFYITSPFEHNMHTYESSWFENVKVVATVYDIIPYIMQERYLPNEEAKTFYMQRVEMLRWADESFVISNSVKEDMVSYLDFDPDKICVIYGAVDSRYKVIDIDSNSKNNLFEKYGITDSYVMCTGGDDDRKNIAGLITAYAKMSKQLIMKYQLVIVCKLSSESYTYYTNLSKKLGVAKRVVLTNFVTDEELLQFYNLATLMAFPSKYEGFGLPIVEAFACETPVLTSNNSSLGEIAGDAAIIVNPFETKDITRGLECALTTDLGELVERGKKRLEIFNWEWVTNTTLVEINKFAEQTKIEEKSKNVKERIAVFTPLPPLKSGIADYSVDILNEIAKYFDIDIYIDDGYQYECLLNDNIKVFNHREYKYYYNDYFTTLYQMGNSIFHEYMHSYIKHYSGSVLVLHDYNLFALAKEIALGELGSLRKYQDILLEDYNRATVKHYIKLFNQGKNYECETNGFMVNYADKIIVHSNDVHRKLLERDISRNIRTIKSYVKVKPKVDKINARKSLGLSLEKVIISSFGHIHETKRVIPTLQAVKKLHEEGAADIQYVFAGEIDASLESKFKTFIDENNMNDIVTVTGYTELEEFNDYIDATDICLNFRYPYNGETSGSLMRILAKGKCVMVNDIGSFSEVPDDACVKIPSVEEMTKGEEVNIIYENLKKLITDDNLIKEYEVVARAYAKENLDISIIGKQYAEWILEEYHSCLNEKIMCSLAMEEIQNKLYLDNELKKLTTTLTFIKS